MLRPVLLTLAVSTLALAAAAPASALTMKECSAKYQAAKAAGGTAKWNDFRKTECSSDATAAPAAAAASTTTSVPNPMVPTAAKPAAPAPAPTTAAAKPAPAPAPTTAAAKPTPAPGAPAESGSTVFPTAVSPKYSSEAAAKARMHTCLDQYNANKAGNGNGGMVWIMKGGGYYSECNKRLKG